MATALDSYMPFDSGAGANVTESGWRNFMRRAVTSGVLRNQTSEFLTQGDSSGMQVKINPGQVWIEGHWGELLASRYEPVAAAHATLVRTDLVVARADFTANTISTAVITNGTAGTGAPPGVTRDSSTWEIPLGVINVPAAASTIAAANVLDARQWGGPPVATITDDYLYWADKISTCSRYNVTGDNAVTNGNVYVAMLRSIGEQTVSEIRMCPTVLPVAGTTTVRIFRGYRPDQLTTFIDPTTSTFLYGGTAQAVHVSAITPTTFRAGETIVIAVAGASTTTAATLASNAITFTGSAATFLNPSTSVGPMTTAFKTAAMPSTINLLDGTWTRRDRVFWAALA